MSNHVLILFDIDGTLLTTFGAGMAALDRATQQVLGFGFKDSGIYPDGMTDPLIVRELFRQKKVPGWQWPQIEGEIWNWYIGFLEEELAQPDLRHRLEPGISPLLEELFVRPDVNLGLLTGNLEKTARLKLDLFGLNRYFPIGAYGSDCADRCRLGKVALERARRHYGTEYPSHRVWIVGDTPRDVEAGKAIKAKVLAVATGRYPLESLQEHLPTAALKDLSSTQEVLRLLLEED